MQTDDLIIKVNPLKNNKLKKIIDNEELLSSAFMRACGGLGTQEFLIHKESKTLIIKNYYDGDFESSAVLDILLFKLHLDNEGDLIPIDVNSNLQFQFNKGTFLVEKEYGNNWFFIKNKNICWGDEETNALFSENDEQIRKIEIPEHTNIEPKEYLKKINAEKVNKRNGQGTKTWANGDEYVGEWKDDKRHGKGTYTYADGNKYVGQWKDGNRTGQGTYTYANGDKYAGEYKDGNMYGQGTYTYASGSKYVGEWKDDKKHGQGTNTYANGNIYIGEWRENMRTGQGIFSWKDGSKYIGELKNNKEHGQGVMTWASGSKYIGEWRESIRTGQGILTWASGNKYIGEFKNSKLHGQGTKTYVNGTVEKGLWENDKFIGE